MNDCGESTPGNKTVTLPYPNGCTWRQGQNQENAISLLRIFPNPSDGHLAIENGNKNSFKIRIESITGVNLNSLIIQPESIEHFENLPNGIFIIQAINDNQTLLSDKNRNR